MSLSYQFEKDISNLAFNSKRIADSLEVIAKCLSENSNQS